MQLVLPEVWLLVCVCACVLFYVSVCAAEYFAVVLSQRYPTLRWSIAGRDREKLTQLLEKVKSLMTGSRDRVGLLVGSITDQKSIDNIVAQSRVMISTAGPFIKYGFPIVDACVRLGCHYTDITGETPFVRALIDRYHASATDKKVVVLPMCGFDSIPSDLGAYFTAKVLSKDCHSLASEVRGFFVSNGGPSGGTLASGQNMLTTPELQAQFDQPFLLGGEHVGSGRAQDTDLKHATFDMRLGIWTAPFGMAKINTRVVRRSVALLADPSASSELSPFSAQFCYNEMAVAPTETLAQKLANPPVPEVVARLISEGRLPKPGSGPSAEARAKSFFGCVFIGKAENAREVMVTLRGGDPGYTETSKMVSESAICLALGLHAGKQRRFGVITPSVALGDTLITILRQAGLDFQVNSFGEASCDYKISAESVASAFISFLPKQNKADLESKQKFLPAKL